MEESDRVVASRGRVRGGRLPALDGLRGLAALVVVVHHSLLTAHPFGDTSDSHSYHGWPWALTFTPLHLLWAGHEAVYVFFVLSGFVLFLPAAAPGFHLRAYYPQRILRLYLPVFAAVLLALVQYEAIKRHVNAGATVWTNTHHEALTLKGLVRDLTLVRGANLLDSPLWSLQYEVVFSLLLPLYVLAALFLRRWYLAGMAALLVVIALGADRNDFLAYLPLFGLGVLLASAREPLGRLGRRLGRGGALLAVPAALLLVASWLLPDQVAGHGPLLFTLEAAGAALVVFLFAFSSSVAWLGEHPAVQWLGMVSFSLYLVHEPIVVSIAALFGSAPNPFLMLVLAVPLSLAVAALFYRLVEARCHRISQRVGRRIAARLEAGASSRLELETGANCD